MQVAAVSKNHGLRPTSSKKWSKPTMESVALKSSPALSTFTGKSESPLGTAGLLHLTGKRAESQPGFNLIDI